MSRLETVYARLAELTKDRGISAGQLAEDLGLARTNVSGDLNRLCQDGRATKEGGKPVFYRARISSSANRRTDFDIFLQRSPSLFSAGEQAKAAVLYPPRGMPILLLGETGVGKSLFARLIHEFALEMGRIKKAASFVIFNCADYANNPELLVSHLFGSRKGSFTGSESDRPGLLEKADGGVLFLDEVHRLPPEGQEMLFSFFDRGRFRRLGDAEEEKSADVLIIAATTESPASALLTAFTRRIPMIIRLPALSERGFDERLDLIKVFFARESSRLGKPIHLSVNALRALLAYQCPNNVGQLASDIQLLCAKAYSDLITQKRTIAEVVTASLPGHIKEGLASETCHRQIWNRLEDMGKRFFVFGEDSAAEEPAAENGESESIYDLIDLRIRELRIRGFGEAAIDRALTAEIEDFFEESCRPRENKTRERMGEDFDRTISEIIGLAEERLGKSLFPFIRTGLSLHVMNAVNRVRSGRNITNPEFNLARKEHPEEFNVAVECLKIIDRVFEISMPLEEAGFLALFFGLERERPESTERTAVVFMAHGESAAQSTAKAVNQLIGVDAVLGIDVPLNASPRSSYERLRNSVAPRQDVLLLVDMGSLMNFGAELEADLGARVKTIPLASTLHALQAARKSLLGLSLDRIYEETLKVDELMARSSKPAARSLPTESPRGYIVALCTTGEGAAAFSKARLEEALPADPGSTGVVAMGISGRQDAKDKLENLERGGRVYCLVTPFRLGLGYTEFGVDDVLDPAGLARIRAHVESESLFDKIVDAHREAFEAVDAREALEGARTFVAEVEEAFGRRLLDGAKVGVYCHIAALIDRTRRGDAFRPSIGAKSVPSVERGMAAVLRRAADRLEGRFAIRVLDGEVGRIAGFFDAGNCREGGFPNGGA